MFEIKQAAADCMSKIELALLFLPSGIVLICLAALWQMYVVLTESYSLSRFKDNQSALLKIAFALFFSFSLAVYWFCPNARKKGVIFLILGLLGCVSYGLGQWWLAPYMK